MTNINILTNYELEINKIDDTFGKPVVDDSLFWLNLAVGKFVKLRFNGDFVHHVGYEQTEKRREDLINLFVTKTYTNEDFIKCTNQPSYDLYFVEYPENFLYTLNEDVIISNNEGEYTMNTCVFECTSDSFMYRITNSLTDFHYKNHKARPLRIRKTIQIESEDKQKTRSANGCALLTDKNYKIDEYVLGYIKKPNEITMENPYDEYVDFPDIVMQEIIKIAAQMYIENQKDERYKTISEEVLTQE